MRASRIGSVVACASLLVACATGGDAFNDGQPGLLGGGGTGNAAGADGGGNARGSGSSSGGGAGGGDDASSAVDSGPGDDASTAIDSGLAGDAGGGGSSGGGADGGGITSTFCGSNPAYYVEALAAYTGGSPPLCGKNADCGSGDCCFQAIKQLPVNVCIKQ